MDSWKQGIINAIKEYLFLTKSTLCPWNLAYVERKNISTKSFFTFRSVFLPLSLWSLPLVFIISGAPFPVSGPRVETVVWIGDFIVEDLRMK